MSRPFNLQKAIARIAGRFAYRRHTDRVVDAARRLLTERPTWKAADSWAADVRWLCGITLGLDTVAGYRAAGSYARTARRILDCLDATSPRALVAQHYGLTRQDVTDASLEMTETLGRAIREENWTMARQAWEWLIEVHPALVDLSPFYPRVSDLLRQEEAMARGAASPAIH